MRSNGQGRGIASALSFVGVDTDERGGEIRMILPIAITVLLSWWWVYDITPPLVSVQAGAVTVTDDGEVASVELQVYGDLVMVVSTDTAGNMGACATDGVSVIGAVVNLGERTAAIENPVFTGRTFYAPRWGPPLAGVHVKVGESPYPFEGVATNDGRWVTNGSVVDWPGR